MADGSLNYTPSKTGREFMLSEHKMRAIMGPVGCLPAESEFLTPTGWKRMDSYEQGDLVAQWTPEGVIEFVEPDEYIVLPQKEAFHRFRSVFSTDMVLSDEHRVVFYDWKGSLREETAGYIAKKFKQGRAEGPRFYVPVTFRLPENRHGISLTDIEIRLMVAVHADGHFPKFYAQKGEARCVIVVRKERKKVRLREILTEADIPWDERTYSGRPTETQFHFTAPRLSKKYDAYWWGVNQHQAEVIYNEFRYWDGLIHPDGEIRYSSVHLSDVEYMQFICHVTGHRATVCKQEYDNSNWNTSYYIQVTRRLDERVTFRNCKYSTVESIDGLKYCFSVPSTYFIARHNNRIFVTGNSGKTTVCIIELLRRAILMTPGEDGLRRSRMLVVRNTKQQLKDTTLASVVGILPVEIYKWRESEMIMRFSFNDVRSDWLFRSLDTPEDVQRVLSLEVSNTWVEEAREVPVQLLSHLEGRTGRYPSQSGGFRYRSGIIYSTNPPEIDSDHYKLLEHLPQEEDNENSIIDVAVFKQPSGLSPEAENLENLRSGYYEELSKGKKQDFVNVYVHGQYARSMAGKPVYEISFQYDKRVKHGLKIDPLLPVIIGVDTARQPAMVFMQLGYDGKLRKFREACGFDMGAKTFIKTKLNPLIKNCFSSNPLVFIGDPSWKTKDNTDDNSWYKELKKQFVTQMPDAGNAVKSAITNDPIARINALDDPFRNMWPDGEPGIEYDSSCTLLVEGLRSKYRYVRMKTTDGKYQDKPEKNKWSHVCEADQYGTMFILGKQYSAADHVRTTIDPFTQTTSTQRVVADKYAGY